MKIPLWVSTAAAAFWEAAGGPEPFPRTLRGPIARSAFDLTLQVLPGLSLRGAERYLAGRGVAWTCGGPDRPLRACLAACAGAGFILLDARDPAEEQVFSLAHELAHFLRHYWLPRQRTCRRLGEDVAAVLDGSRPPTPGERLDALLADIPLGPHLHLMRRGPRRELPAAEAAAEDEADRLAYELLAPAAAVAEHGALERGQVTQVLSERFGLPAAQATDYADRLLPQAAEDPLLRQLFGEQPGPR
jgi:hypothetical protein